MKGIKKQEERSVWIKKGSVFSSIASAAGRRGLSGLPRTVARRSVSGWRGSVCRERPGRRARLQGAGLHSPSGASAGGWAPGPGCGLGSAWTLWPEAEVSFVSETHLM